MEMVIILILIGLSLLLFANRIKKQFDANSEGCGGNCGSCQLNTPGHRIIIEEGREDGENEKS